MAAPAVRGDEAGKNVPAGTAAFWSLQPVQRPAAPKVAGAKAGDHPIDSFVRAELQKKGLRPSPEADRRTLIRRATFDLLGLPPTPAEVEEFINDSAPDAYERLIDRLLASPHYGERWGRHWLDVAHYADTHGFERDFRRPNAWRYRDWVINAFNRDLPYDQFLRDQIAGDVIAPDDPRGVIATGFLAAGPWDFVGHEETKSPMLRRKARADDLDDMITTVITAGVGMTIHCARCHDHKFDPIPTADYYRLTAVFAGARRGDRPIDPTIESRRWELTQRISAIEAAMAPAKGDRIDLADVVGGGNGFGSGTKSAGIDPRTGEPTTERAQYLDEITVNAYRPTTVNFVDGVFIPDGGEAEKIQIASTHLTAAGLPDTSGESWDFVANGSFTQQKSTKLGDIDYATPGHSMLGLHVNKGITFDLSAMRTAYPGRRLLRFQATAGNGDVGASDFWVFIDGEKIISQTRITEASGPFPLNIELGEKARFLTLVATDGGDGISNDQIFFGDPHLVLSPMEARPEESPQVREALVAERDAARRELEALPAEEKVYAVLPADVAVTKVLRRGDAESPTDPVTPGALSCVTALPPDLGDDQTPEGQRRLALAQWITHPDNPLTARVIVNRLWHYHFGRGIVATPSDFGRNGEPPTHPELLDWLASELVERKWSLKEMHRLIMTSATYRQSSRPGADAVAKAAAVDAENRLLWRMNGRRLEAEAVRDAILAASGKLNLEAGGPGFESFNFVDKYAPIYEYITADRPELWRRTVYSFVVRSVPDGFMEVLDCPNPSNFTPARNATTTALQALSLSNNPFVIQQAKFFAQRLENEAGADAAAQIERAYRLAFSRPPTAEEMKLSEAFIAKSGLFPFCRALLNANEFVYAD